MDYGRNVIGSTGIPINVSADGQPEWKSNGLSIDWTTITAVNADTTIQPEGLTVKNGQKYLRFGQVLTRITNQNVFTIAQTGTWSGGTFTITVQRPDTLAYMKTAAIAYNASAAAVTAAIQQALAGGASTGITVTTGFPVSTAFASVTWTVTTAITIISVDASGITGTTPGVTLTQTTTVGNYGMFGPFDPSASDGRQTLNNGEVCVLNNTVLQNGIMGIGVSQIATNHPGGIVGGRVWKDRLIATNGTHSLAAGPTYAELLSALPRLQFVGQS